MKSYSVVVGIALLLCLTTGCEQSSTTVASQSYTINQSEDPIILRYFSDATRHNAYQISADQLYQWLYVQHKTVSLIDVRQPIGDKSFQTGHIPDAHNSLASLWPGN